jgi:dienelactone hydrolase
VSNQSILAVWLRRLALVGILLGLTLWGLAATGYLGAFSVVVRAADLQGLLRRVANLGTVRHVERLAAVPSQAGSPISVRIYAPAGASRQTVLLVAGLHPAGIYEPRLMALARELAKSRITVVTPNIRGLSRFAITPALTDDIEHVARWLAIDSGLAPTGRIGLIGISFTGGLAVVAAGRQSLRHHVSYVLSVGGHGDLPRVLHYLCTGVMHEGSPTIGHGDPLEGVPRPHDYGQAVVLLNVADRLVPLGQVDALRSFVRRFLWASYLHRADQSRAAAEFAALRDEVRMAPEPSATLLRHLSDRDVERLGSQLLAHIGDYGNEPALSPDRSPPPAAGVFLLHGRSDSVIPAVESQYLADDLRGDTCVRLLITDLLSHADLDQPKRIGQIFKLIDFWRDVLVRSAADRTAANANCLSS